MRREFHVRFCEGAGVRFPRATRLVLVFQRETDARRVLEVLVRPSPPPGPDSSAALLSAKAGRSAAARGTEELRLSRLHPLLEKSRRGFWVVKRKTASDRFTRFLRKLNLECKGDRHVPMA
jgi:RNA-directed DNA polymerase